MTDFAEFRLRVEPGPTPTTYRVEASSIGGNASETFEMPFSDVQLENFILKVGRTRRGVRRMDSPEVQLARSFGGKLFSALMSGSVLDAFRVASAEARARNGGLRVMLSMTDVPRLAAIPWEFLYDDPDFLATSRRTPVVRYIDVAKPSRPLDLALPLRILAVVSSPSNAPMLRTDQERAKLEMALAHLVTRGAVEIDWLEDATQLALTRKMRHAEYHILHFIGHGGFDEAHKEGALLFEDDSGAGRIVGGDQLAAMVGDLASLRLVVLNSTEGARSLVEDPFSSVAEALVKRGMPAVIGMQFEITDRAAMIFATELFAAIAEGQPVDTAVAEARRAIFADQNDVEWATPVLFMRVADGRLFNIIDAAPVVRVEPDLPPKAADPAPSPSPDVLSATAAAATAPPPPTPIAGPTIAHPTPMPRPRPVSDSRVSSEAAGRTGAGAPTTGRVVLPTDSARQTTGWHKPGLGGRVADVIRSWTRREPTRAAKITIDGDKLELGGMSEEDQRRLIEEWMARHEPSRRAQAGAARTYKAYGLLDCAEVVAPGQTFPLRLGLGEKPAVGVSGGPFMPPVPIEPYDIDIKLFADGFDLRPGEAWRHSLRITPDDLFPTTVVHLTARDLPDKMADREITATFSIDGETLGFAKRSVRVSADESVLADAIAAPQRATGANITAPTGEPKAHVTITIKRGLAPGLLLWGIESDLPGVGLPKDRETTSNIGDEPKTFALAIIRTLLAKGKQAGLFHVLQGIGLTVHDRMPRAVRDALATAATAVAPEKLLVLLLTDEPYVPWELATLDEPFDPTAPNYLGAQANVGRWILDEGEPTDAPRRVSASSMAVVWGVYKSGPLPRLEAAEQEAGSLTERYRAASVDAQPDPVTRLLDGTPPADIIHFAVHGKYDPGAPGEGIYLVSGAPIGPIEIRGHDLRARAPFVFLNACQVGSAETLLGDYSGIAQAFLKVGASAVVAPLWSIDDVVAQRIALEFYGKALAPAGGAGPGSPAEPPPVADLLRQARSQLAANAGDLSATYLAYQFYGHPTLKLLWASDPATKTEP